MRDGNLRLNAIYWGLTALSIMGHPDALDREEMIYFMMSCWDDEAGATVCKFIFTLSREGIREEYTGGDAILVRISGLP
jgi:hypothetical protein